MVMLISEGFHQQTQELRVQLTFGAVLSRNEKFDKIIV